MEMVVTFPREKAPAAADVKKLAELASDLVKDIAKKDSK